MPGYEMSDQRSNREESIGSLLDLAIGEFTGGRKSRFHEPLVSRLRYSSGEDRLGEKSGVSHHLIVTSNGPSKLARYLSRMGAD
jgi:hypothetical protein